MHFQTLKTTKKTPFLNKMVLFRTDPLLCVGILDPKYPSHFMSELALFHGIFAHRIWRPVSIFKDIWKILYITEP